MMVEKRIALLKDLDFLAEKYLEYAKLLLETNQEMVAINSALGAKKLPATHHSALNIPLSGSFTAWKSQPTKIGNGGKVLIVHSGDNLRRRINQIQLGLEG